MGKEELFDKISTAVVDMEDEEVIFLCRQSLDMEIDAAETIKHGLIAGMDQVSKLYETGEYFLPEVLTASYALNEGIEILKPHINRKRQVKV